MIDAHIHLFQRVSTKYRRAVYDIFPPERAVLAEDFIPEMDKNGVSQAVVVALSPETTYLAEVLRQYPDRFVGIAVFDTGQQAPQIPVRALSRIFGIRGIRVHRMAGPEDSGWPATKAFMGAMADHGLALWFYGGPDDLAEIGPLARRWPQVPIVLNHLGFCPLQVGVDADGRRIIATPLPPATLPTVLDLADEKNVNVMVSGQYAFSRLPYPHHDIDPTLHAIYRAYGADRLMWASDYPASSPVADYAQQGKIVRATLSMATPTELRSIEGETARRVLRITSARTSPQAVA